MRILQATSEFFPYSKTGGLADMVAGLSGALAELGEDVTVATPLYRGIREQVPDLKPFGPKVILPLGKQTFTGRWWKATESNGLTLLFLEQEDFYDRPGLYMANGNGYWDNPERFMFLSKAVAQLAGEYNVVHVHDWQTAFVPMLLRASGSRDIPRTVLTIHNLAYQGQCEATRFEITNLPWNWFHSEGPEFWGNLNFLKAGLHYADAITTVSPRYSEEILTPEFGEGMEGVLQSRQGVLSGILNGVDYSEWRTTNNPYLAAPYHADDLAGKNICKQFIQKEVGLNIKFSPPEFNELTQHEDISHILPVRRGGRNSRQRKDRRGRPNDGSNRNRDKKHYGRRNGNDDTRGGSRGSRGNNRGRGQGQRGGGDSNRQGGGGKPRFNRNNRPPKGPGRSRGRGGDNKRKSRNNHSR